MAKVGFLYLWNTTSSLKLLSMKKLLFFLLMLGLSPQMSGQYNPEINTLTWSDEFDKNGLPDPAKWGYEEGYVRNKELQYYTKENKKNVVQEKGCLVITARKENKGDYPITSGSINTLGKYAFFYGRVEVCAKLPLGLGSWPAIWMMGTDIRDKGWPECGEIDIMENVGFEPNRIYATVHTPGTRKDASKVKQGNSLMLEDAHTAFHVYAVEWYPDRLDFFLDGRKYHTYAKESTLPDYWRFDKPQYLLLNLAFGGAWGGTKGVDESVLPLQYSIDWVRYYQ